MSNSAHGGIVTGGGPLYLADDECLLDRRGGCIRNDERHHYEWIEGPRRLSDLEPRMVRGRCLHRACHVEPVESGGTVVAHLCRACDTQLPAERWP